LLLFKGRSLVRGLRDSRSKKKEEDSKSADGPFGYEGEHMAGPSAAALTHFPALCWSEER
jgi:hypothetical protein